MHSGRRAFDGTRLPTLADLRPTGSGFKLRVKWGKAQQDAADFYWVPLLPCEVRITEASPAPDAMHQPAQYNPDMPTLQNTPLYIKEIYDAVSDSGLYNFQKTRARIPCGFNIENWCRYLEDYSDPNLAD